MKRRKTLYLCALGVLTSVLLIGCGDGSEENSELAQGVASVNSGPLLSVAERAIYDYELKYHTATFEMQDYYALAELYGEVGRIREQRDMLEQCYRLFEDAEALEELRGIAVNLAEEEEAIAAEAELMLQNLELPEYLDESVNMIVNSNWMRTMMPKLAAGSRNYFLQREGRTVLMVQVGYDEAGLPYSNVWYVNADNQLTLLQYDHSAVKMLRTTLAEGMYDGSFEVWTIDGSTGNILQEQGTFAKGLYTGDYTRKIHVGTEGSDLFALWCNRQSMEYLVYTGHFDGQGRTTLEQPDAENQAALLADSGMTACVVYAYDEAGQNCLFEAVEEGVDLASYAFDMHFMGVEGYPVYEVYEVEAEDVASDGIDEEKSDEKSDEIQIRVFDGEIQYFNGYRWVSAGTAKELAEADPFRAYAEKKEAFENNLWGITGDGSSVDSDSEITNGDSTGENAENTGEAGSNAGNVLGMGSITTTPTPTVPPTATPTPTKKPTANTGSTTVVQKPTATPAPTPAPTPVPSTPEPDDDDDDDDSGTSSTPTPSTPTPSTPTPSTPEPSTPEPEPDNGGDDSGGDSGDSGSDDGGSDDSGDGEDMDWSDTVM